MSSIRFSRKPYTITYKDLRSGELRQIKRRPPPKLHDILPTDQVELLRSKNEDWQEEGIYTVKHINPRHPNVIQVMDEDLGTTFVDYFDLEIDEKVAFRGGDSRDDPRYNRYLTWP